VALRPDAATLIDRLREAGHMVAILTGGFERGVQRALEADDTAVDMIVSNRLPIADGELTGEVEGPLIEGTKDDQLAELAGELDVEMADTIAVGDGANDLPMLEVAGLAVGFEPKPAVEPSCDDVVSTMAALGTLLESRGVLAAAVDD